jgi:hypothetical protein
MPRFSDKTFPRPVRAIEVAPGIKALPVDVRQIPAMGAFEWVCKRVIFEETNQRGVAYVPVMRIRDAWIRVSEAEKLPFGLSAEVIVRLVRAGFVEGGQPAPNNTVVNVASLLAHYDATLEDLDFWTPERRRRFKEAGN